MVRLDFGLPNKRENTMKKILKVIAWLLLLILPLTACAQAPGAAKARAAAAAAKKWGFMCWVSCGCMRW